MAEDFPAGTIPVESSPNGQIAAFYEGGKRLFDVSEKRFGAPGRGNVGTVDARVLDHARYRHPQGGDIVTVRDSTAPLWAKESASGSVTITIETPLPWSLDFPNAYIREEFGFAGFGGSETYDYSLGISEYTLEGKPKHSRTFEEVKYAHPQETAGLGAGCTPEHFTDQLLTIVQLSPDDEVGCEPNPYFQIYQG